MARDRPSHYSHGIGMARDRPSPYELGEGCAWHGEGQTLALREWEKANIGMARDRPSPYGEGDCFFIVARGPVPRDRSMARDRPSPYRRQK